MGEGVKILKPGNLSHPGDTLLCLQEILQKDGVHFTQESANSSVGSAAVSFAGGAGTQVVLKRFPVAQLATCSTNSAKGHKSARMQRMPPYGAQNMRGARCGRGMKCN